MPSLPFHDALSALRKPSRHEQLLELIRAKPALEIPADAHRAFVGPQPLHGYVTHSLNASTDRVIAKRPMAYKEPPKPKRFRRFSET